MGAMFLRGCIISGTQVDWVRPESVAESVIDQEMVKRAGPSLVGCTESPKPLWEWLGWTWTEVHINVSHTPQTSMTDLKPR